MILEIQHETRFEYAAPVTEALTELHLEPVTDADQSCHSFHLAIVPPTELFRYQDGFGNRVHHFNLLAPHDRVTILAASVVVTHPRLRDLTASQSVYPVRFDQAPLDVQDFLSFRGPVTDTPLLRPILDKVRPEAGALLAPFILRVGAAICSQFEYARDVTLATSPIEDLLQHGKGVCQDFTHLMIAILRSFQVPARYVSGYIHRPDRESQSHAWCEAWLPDLGWLGIDPTNDRPADDHFVKVAVGRDFSDVPPNKGIYRGSGPESISVRVETRSLERLPSLSWQEQLPPLHVPLTAIVPRRGDRIPRSGDDEQQQQ